jgi:hypothetical protein
LCDFIAAERLGAPITGEIYRHFDSGPIAKHLLPVLKDMEEKKILNVEKIKLRDGKKFTKFTARRKCSNDVFTKEQTEIIEEVLRRFGSWTWNELVEYVHQDLTFRLTERNAEIPYFLAPYRRYEKPRKEEAERLLADSDYVRAIEAALT